MSITNTSPFYLTYAYSYAPLSPVYGLYVIVFLESMVGKGGYYARIYAF